VRRPDFGLVFRDYVYFWVGPEGDLDSEVAVGRKYRDVFFDLHRFGRPAGAREWDAAAAVREFLRRKIRANFVPQNLSYEDLPEGAGPQHPLTVEQLDAVFDTIT